MCECACLCVHDLIAIEWVVCSKINTLSHIDTYKHTRTITYTYSHTNTHEFL